MFFKKGMSLLLTIAMFFAAILTGQRSLADTGLYGSGYWGGQQQCGYPTRVGQNAVSMSDEEKEAREKVAEGKKDLKIRKLELKRAQERLAYLEQKINRYFDSEIAEFLLKTHIELGNLCENYKTSPGLDCVKPTAGAVTTQPADPTGTPKGEVTAACGGKMDVPDKLMKTWTKAEGGGYCAANSTGNKGLISGSICSDLTLRPTDGVKNSTVDCPKDLAEYRKQKIERDNAQAKFERAERDVKDADFAISDAKARAKIDREYKLKTQVEGECEECLAEGRGYRYEKPKTDWWNVAAQVGLGLGLGFVGKRYDESRMEYQAQLGYPPTQGYPTAVSMGLPFILGGVYGAVNGGAGQGGFGCAGGTGGAGNPYGAGPYGGMNGGANGAYGPFGAQGGAFGYPQGMYGSPWGGGMYNPGMGPYGGFNGPNGGFPGGMNGQFGVGIPMNGQFGNPMGGYPGAGGGYPGAGGGGFAANGGFAGGGAAGGGYPGMGGYPGAGGGYPGMAAGGGFAANGSFAGGGAAGGGYPGMGSYMNNPQIQIQMMQQQQQMLQQQMQYYQAQQQAQMQEYQRRMQVQQQAVQVQQEIASLQMRLQMLYSGAYQGSSGGGSIGGGIYGGVTIGAAAPTPGYTPGYNTGGAMPTGAAQATVPGPGTAPRTGR